MNGEKLKEWLEGQIVQYNYGNYGTQIDRGKASAYNDVLDALNEGKFDLIIGVEHKESSPSTYQRYELAKAAMEGMLSKSDDLSYESVAKSAIAYADEMIKQLSAEKKWEK